MRKTLNLIAFILLLLGVASAEDEGGHWNGPPSVALYTARTELPTPKDLGRLAPAARVEELDGGGWLVVWPDLKVRVFLGYQGDFAQHLNGMAGFVQQMSAEQPEAGQAVKVRMKSFRNSVGLTIMPGFDEEGRAWALVRKLAEELDATLFTAASFYDKSGQPILYNGGPRKLY